MVIHLWLPVSTGSSVIDRIPLHETRYILPRDGPTESVNSLASSQKRGLKTIMARTLRQFGPDIVGQCFVLLYIVIYGRQRRGGQRGSPGVSQRQNNCLGMHIILYRPGRVSYRCRRRSLCRLGRVMMGWYFSDPSHAQAGIILYYIQTGAVAATVTAAALFHLKQLHLHSTLH